MENEFARRLERALKLNYPYPWRIPPQNATLSATLVLFAGSQSGPELLLTRRSDDLEHHKGQIAFPGGMRDPEDSTDEMTALREAQEEVGVPPELVQIVGRLPSLSTMTGYSITPVVGVLNVPSDEIELKTNPAEVAEIFWTPLTTLLNPSTYRQEEFTRGSQTFPIDVFMLSSHRVWGATGSILKNLVDRIRSLG